MQFFRFFFAGLSALAFLSYGIISGFKQFNEIAMLSGFLLIFSTMDFIFSDKKPTHGLLSAAKIATCLSLCFLSGVWFIFILLSFIIPETKGRNILVFVLPMAGYITFRAASFTGSSEQTARFLLECFLIIFGGLLILLIERGISQIMYNREKLYEALCRSADEELQEKQMNKELSIKNYLMARNARLEEREKISRNIHNSVGHTITAAIMALDAAQAVYGKSPQIAWEKISVADERIHQSLSEIRGAVRMLDEDEKAIPMEIFISRLTDEISRFRTETGIKIRDNLSETSILKTIPSEKAVFLQSVLLEALTNGVRHGNATAFAVILVQDSSHVSFCIEDNGKTTGHLSKEQISERLNNGFGLKKIKEYAEYCGGSVKIRHGDGFRLTVELPLSDEEAG